MKETIQCPQCTEDITVEHIIDAATPFTMRCPYCKVKLKETKVTPILIGAAMIMIPLFIYLGVSVKEILTNYFPIVDKVPTIIVFFAFCYPLYYVYEKYNALWIVNKGKLKIRK
jgi:hypothetical protein